MWNREVQQQKVKYMINSYPTNKRNIATLVFYLYLRLSFNGNLISLETIKSDCLERIGWRLVSPFSQTVNSFRVVNKIHHSFSSWQISIKNWSLSYSIVYGIEEFLTKTYKIEATLQEELAFIISHLPKCTVLTAWIQYQYKRWFQTLKIKVYCLDT